MNAIQRIPDKELLNQDTYLVNGELKWEGQTSPVFSTISSTEKYAPTILVLSLLWEKQKAIGG
jgi:glyceraldehyde-3-phosphate dehydrogenase (NADP+)